MKVIIEAYCPMAPQNDRPAERRQLMTMDGSPGDLAALIPQCGDFLTLTGRDGAIENDYQIYEVVNRNFTPGETVTRIELGVRLYDYAKGFGFGPNDFHREVKQEN